MDITKIHLFLIYFLIWMKSASFSEVEELDYRLPMTHIPQNYSLILNLNPDENKFSGEVTVPLMTLLNTTSFFLHASPSRITIKEILLNFVHNCEASYLSKKTEILNISCPILMEQNEINTLDIKYEGVFGTTGTEEEYLGLYKSSYDTTEELKNYAVTQFEPTYARAAFPCLDEPQFKTPFQITVKHPPSYSVLSNANISSQTSSDGVVVTKFKTTPPMATYLIGFLISSFNTTSDKSTSSPTIKVHSRGSQVEHTGTAIQYARKLVDALGSWLNKKYEDLGIEKLDLVAVPHFLFGAMENWGLITFQEADLLDEGKQTSAVDRQQIISTIAHELAHHWFGDYVTLDWWSNAWLNEGFATYFQYHILDMVDDLKMELGRQFVPLCLHIAFEADGPESLPLTSPYENINSTSDDLSKFDEISYNKGASIIRMIRSILGEEKFQKSLQAYLTENRYNSTNPIKLLSSIDENYGKKEINIQEALKPWIYQPGYPIVTVNLNEKEHVVITQEEFSRNSGANDSKSIWSIPLTYTTSKNIDFDIKEIQWLTDNSSIEISIESNSWIILNLQQTGYYRVNYNDDLWNRLISALTSNKLNLIHVSNRAQLIDDVFSLAKVGKVSYQIAFDLASYLYQEREFEPWYAAAKSFKFLGRMLEAYGDNDALQNLQMVVLKWVDGAFPDKSNSTTHLQILTNQIINTLKCEMNHGKCLEESQNILKNYLDNRKIKDYNVRKTALCFGLKISKTQYDDYNSLLNFYKDSNSALERRAILSSLGCITDPTILNKYLMELLSNSTVISRPDVKYVYKAIVSNNIQGIEASLTFLKDHLKDILDRYSELITISDLILQPAKWITSDKRLSQLQEIIEKYKDIDGMKEIGKKAVELPSINKRWFDRNRKDFDLILQRMASSSIFIMPNMVLVMMSIWVILKM